MAPRIFLLMSLIIFPLNTYALDKVQMKNGDVYRGEIIEQRFGEFVQIRFQNGNEKRLPEKDMESIKKEKTREIASEGQEEEVGDAAELAEQINNIVDQEEEVRDVSGNSTKSNTLLFGGAFPLGDFGSNQGGTDSKDGFAKQGFSLIYEGHYNFSSGLSWVVSGSISINELDTDTMENLSDLDVDISSGSYVSNWTLAGIRAENRLTPSLSLYGQVQAGLLISFFPNIALSLKTSPYTSVLQKTETSFALGYGLGGGIVINKLIIGIRLYGSSPDYTQTAESGSITGTPVTVNLPMTILQLMVGFSF